MYLQRSVEHGGRIVWLHARSDGLVVTHVRRCVSRKAVERFSDWLVLVFHCHTHRLDISPALVVRTV